VRLSALEVVAMAAGLAGVGAAMDAGWSHANGRPPDTTGVGFPPGDDATIILPATFGLLISTDAGDSFRWVCEDAIGYSGMFDPDYAVTAGGALYANSHQGLRLSEDGGCTWRTIGGVLDGDPYISEVEVGPDGRVWVATANGGAPNDVYVSSDGESFASANLPADGSWWVSLRTTAADPDRIYVSGFEPHEGDEPDSALLRRSDSGGATWDELPVGDFAFGAQPDLLLAGVSPTDPDVVFARAVLAVEDSGDALYRSSDGGESWQQVAIFAEKVSAFLIRPDGRTVIAGSVGACPEDIAGGVAPEHGCVRISRDAGVTWTRAEQEPRLACIGERGDGVLFGCGASFGADHFALGRSDDGETWDGVFRLEETAGPLACPASTAQAECALRTWPTQCEPLDACPPAGGEGGGGDDGGCCRVGEQSGGGWLPCAVLVLILWRRRPARPDSPGRRPRPGRRERPGGSGPTRA
jgi:photosystem II stability/assembly factor-like uncharacterized protein